MKNLSLSVVIITLNEERNIGRCLRSLRFSGKVFSKPEVIVVDASTGEEESQQGAAPADGDEPEEKPDSILPWGTPNKPPKEGGKG